jgi:hypothetical protein
MSVKEVLRLIVEADTKGAVREIDKFGKATNKSLTSTQKGLDKFGAGLTKAGIGMLGVGTVAAVGLASAAKSASDLGEVMSKNTVVFGQSAAKVEEFAENAAEIGQSKKAALEAATGFGNLFVSMGLATDKSADMSVELTKLGSDLASFSNTSPEEAIEALSAALIGEAEPIRKYGVLLDDATLKQKALSMGLIETTGGVLPPAVRAQAAYAAILEQTKTAQGDFARTGDSAANQQRKLTASFENLKAEIGQGALPVMETLLSVATKLTTGFSGLNDASGGLAGKVATIGTVGLIASGGLSLIVGQTIKMRSSIGDAITTIGSLSGKLGGLGNIVKGGAIIAGILAVDKALDEAFGTGTEVSTANLGRLEKALMQFGKTGRVTAELASVVGRDFGKLGEALSTSDLSGVDKARDSLDRFARSVPVAGRVLSSDFAQGVDQARQTLDDFDKSLARIAQTDPAAAFDILKAASRELGVSVKDLMPALDDYDQVVGDVSASAEKAGIPVDNFGVALDKNADSADAAKDALKEYEDQLHALLDPLFGMQDALLSNLDAQADVNAKQLEAVAAEKAYLAAVDKHGPKSKEAQAASLELMGAQKALSDANRGAVRTALDVDSAIAEMRAEIEKNPKALDQAKEKLREWQRQGLITAEQAMRTGVEFDDLAGSIRHVPGSKTVAVGTKGIHTAKVNIASVKSDLDRFPSNKQVTLHFAATGLNAIRIAEAKLLSGQRAVGGPVVADKAYLVGEKGPEVFLPNSSGMIIPNNKMGTVAMANLAGGTGGSTYVDNRTISIQVTSNDGKAVVEAIKKYERSNGAGWRG